MTERELTVQVMKLCDELGLLYHHCPNSSRCEGSNGLPDLIVLGQGGLLLAELKADEGNTTHGQQLWLRTAAVARRPLLSEFLDEILSCHIWRPVDLERGTIRQALYQLV